MTGAEFQSAALAALDRLSPSCREPQVFMDRPTCNCWLGITEARTIIEGLPT